MIGVSPAPVDGSSFLSMRITSISGTSENLGTRYCARLRLLHHAVLEVHRLEQRPADPVDDRTRDLRLQANRIHHRTAIERRDDAHDLHRARRAVRRHLGARGDVPALVEPTRDPDAAAARRLRPPPEPIRSRRERRLQPSVSRLNSRKVSGSISTSRASSSTCISRAMLFAVAASPRYEPWRSGESLG